LLLGRPASELKLLLDLHQKLAKKRRPLAPLAIVLMKKKKKGKRTKKKKTRSVQSPKKCDFIIFS
jgi:hypothetical protein